MRLMYRIELYGCNGANIGQSKYSTEQMYYSSIYCQLFTTLYGKMGIQRMQFVTIHVKRQCMQHILPFY